MVLTAPGRTAARQSTRIPIHAPTAEARADLKRAAEVVYAHAQAAHVLELHKLTKPTITVAAYLAWYRRHVSSQKRGKDVEALMLDRFTRDLGTLTLADLTRDRIMEWRTARLASVRKVPIRASTVNREMTLLHHVLASAVPRYLDVSPIAGLRPLHAPSRPGLTISREDEAKILAAMAPADQAIVIAALDTLIRANDLLSLTWGDDLGHSLSVANPKGGELYRVPVSTRLRAALDCLPRTGRFIFQHRHCGRLHRREVRLLLERACRKAKVRYGRERGGITWHSLRHTGATRMLEAGVNIETVRRIGNWRTFKVLQRYLHPVDAHAAVDLIGRVLEV